MNKSKNVSTIVAANKNEFGYAKMSINEDTMVKLCYNI